ncbi:hypothetical protein EYC84_005889 [Monilinia fructicola]|uniref:Uncharacterized protein n=1 Tax=Monilinia fructicola TaxID=38448 RepID=A0A5M9K0K5_MONFR|nr:hypothetical protein EYC84_005889 [Monilinia fructicola]
MKSPPNLECTHPLQVLTLKPQPHLGLGRIFSFPFCPLQRFRSLWCASYLIDRSICKHRCEMHKLLAVRESVNVDYKKTESHESMIQFAQIQI